MIKNVVLDIGGVLANYHTLDYYTSRGYSEETARELVKVTMESPYWAQNDIGLMPYDWILGKMKALNPSLSDEIEKSLRHQTGIVSRRKESKDWKNDHFTNSAIYIIKQANNDKRFGCLTR